MVPLAYIASGRRKDTLPSQVSALADVIEPVIQPHRSTLLDVLLDVSVHQVVRDELLSSLIVARRPLQAEQALLNFLWNDISQPESPA